MAKWLRCRINGEERVGVADGLGSVNLCDGKLFENPKITDKIVSYDDIEILTPCIPSKIIALWNNSKSNAEKLKKELEEKMAGSTFYKSNPNEISKCQKTLGKLKKDLLITETRWLKLQDALGGADE